MSTITGARKRRGTIRSSITRLINRLSVLEGKTADYATLDLAQDAAKKLGELNQEFRTHHYQLLDLIEEEDDEALAKEQKELDSHDDVIDDTNVRIK